MLFSTGLMFGKTGNRPAPRPDLPGLHLQGDTGFYYVCLIVVLVGCAAVFLVNRSRLGRLLQGLAESPVALTTHGMSVNVTRVLVFGASALLAGVAGGLFAALTGTISGVSFGAFASLTWLTVLAIAGPGEFSAAFIAAFLLAVLPSYVNRQGFTEWQPVGFGVAAVVAALGMNGRFRFGERLERSAARSAERGRFSPVADRVSTNGAGEVPVTSVSGGDDRD
jgi:ABC-type branched-subunit amino acid transport system permease subunit